MDLHLSNNQNVKACLISRKMLHFIFRFGQGNIFWKSSWYIMIIILHLANHDKIVLPHIAQLHHHQVLGDGDHAVHLHARHVWVPLGTCQDDKWMKYCQICHSSVCYNVNVLKVVFKNDQLHVDLRANSVQANCTRNNHSAWLTFNIHSFIDMLVDLPHSTEKLALQHFL